MAGAEGPARKRARSDSERRETLTCALCLEVFTCPKMLPCHHTFCLPCLQGLTAHLGAPSFPCPQCRHTVPIPRGGVEAFQSNFYLPPEELTTAREHAECLVHPGQDLDMYCSDCQAVLCAKCVLAVHRLHATSERAQALQEAQAQLADDEQRLQGAVSSLIEGVAADRAELQAVQDKRAAVEAVIRRKHATLLTMANRARDQALAGLQAVSGEIERRVGQDLHSKRGNLDQLCLLQQRLQQASASGEDCRLLRVAQEMREGWGTPEAVRDLVPPPRAWHHLPVLCSPIDHALCTLHLHDFFGTVYEPPVRAYPTDVTVKEQFRCVGEGEGEDVEVFSLCPSEDGSKVCLSFSRRGLLEDVPVQKYDESGRHISSHPESTGRHSWKSRGSGKGLCSKLTPACLQTYDKSHKTTIFKLVNVLSGTAEVRTTWVVSDDPFTVEQKTEFTILVGPHRAFDVSHSEQLLVVVEEAQLPGGQRRVLLFRRGQQTPSALYHPPSAMCQPADVCFFKLGGEEVVLIADERMDCVHVAGVIYPAGPGEQTALRFLRFLAPGCPLLVQPTALNVDSRGRLWVACRGGAILTCTPVS